MAKLSNIQEAKEFVQANKQALSEMGFSGKEVEKIFADIVKSLDNQRRLNSENLEIYKQATQQARIEAQALKEKTKVQKKANDEAKKGIEEQIKAHTKNIKKIGDTASSIVKNIPLIGDTFGSIIDDISSDYQKFFKESIEQQSKDKSKDAASNLQAGLSGGAKAGAAALGAGLLFAGKQAFDTMTSLGLDFSQTLGLNLQIFFGKELEAITNEFGSINDSSLRLVGSMKLFSVFTGTSTEDLAKSVGLMAATSDLTNEQLMSQIKITKQMAQQAGIPIKNIMSDVAQNTEFFAKFSKDGGQNIFEAATQARKLGISLSEVSKISESLLDFETSIEKQLEAQVLLGRNINTDRARQLAFAGDTEGLLKEVTRLAGSEAEFNKMNFLQREALAGAIGLSVEELTKLVRKENEAKEASNSFFNATVGIVAALGGALGLLIGGLTGGAGFARMAGFGLAGVGVGASIGTLASAISAPGFQTGGIIEGDGLFRGGEAGPEVIAPIPGEGVNVDMSETNALLRQLISSSDRQVNKLADIGTS